MICKGLLRHYWMKKDAKLMYNDALCVKKKKTPKKVLFLFYFFIKKKSFKQIFLYECTGNALKGYMLIILETWLGKGTQRQKVVQRDLVISVMF